MNKDHDWKDLCGKFWDENSKEIYLKWPDPKGGYLDPAEMSERMSVWLESQWSAEPSKNFENNMNGD